VSDLWVRFEGSKTAGRELVKAAAQGGAFPVAEEALFRLPAERRDDGLKAAIQEFARVGQPGQWLTIYGGRPLGRNPDRLIFLPESVEACLSYAEARQQTGAAMESLPDALPAPRPIVAITRPVARPAERVEPLHVHPVPMARKHRAPAPVRTREPVRKRRVGRRLLTIVASLALIGVGISIGATTLGAQAQSQPPTYALNEQTARLMHIPLAPSLLHKTTRVDGLHTSPAAGAVRYADIVDGSQPLGITEAAQSQLYRAAQAARPAIYNVTSIGGTGYYYATAFAVEATIDSRVVGGLLTASHVIDELSSIDAQGIEFSQTSPSGARTADLQLRWGGSQPNVTYLNSAAPNNYALRGLHSWPWRPEFWSAPAWVKTPFVLYGWSPWDIAFLPLSRPLPGSLQIQSFTTARYNQPVVAIGNPDDRGNRYGDIVTYGKILDSQANFTDGWNTDEDKKGIMMEMAAHPGDSGAPILNTSGKVIGVLDATSYSSSANEIFTFAQGVNPYFLDWR